ncbi:hypothetical protein B0H12DRAFT_1174075 [Mycena haematopus]|nr:hypothetical protein B0H12DRAFT_1174075 [Mycena haematopus]
MYRVSSGFPGMSVQQREENALSPVLTLVGCSKFNLNQCETNSTFTSIYLALQRNFKAYDYHPNGLEEEPPRPR